MTTARYPNTSMTQNQYDNTTSFGIMLAPGLGMRITIARSFNWSRLTNRQLLQQAYEDIARQLARYALEEDEHQGRQL